MICFTLGNVKLIMVTSTTPENIKKSNLKIFLTLIVILMLQIKSKLLRLQQPTPLPTTTQNNFPDVSPFALSFEIIPSPKHFQLNTGI